MFSINNVCYLQSILNQGSLFLLLLWSFFFFFKILFICQRERQNTSRGRGRQREKQAPLRARSPMWDRAPGSSSTLSRKSAWDSLSLSLPLPLLTLSKKKKKKKKRVIPELLTQYGNGHFRTPADSVPLPVCFNTVSYCSLAEYGEVWWKYEPGQFEIFISGILSFILTRKGSSCEKHCSTDKAYKI